MGYSTLDRRRPSILRTLASALALVGVVLLAGLLGEEL